MYVKYGTFQHPDNTVSMANFIMRAGRSRNGIRQTTIMEMHVIGELLASTQAAFTTAITNLNNAYSVDYQDFGFYQDDNTPTPHVLQNNHPNNLTGNVVIYRNFPNGDGAEYASKRTFAVGVRAEFINSYTEFIAYNDTIVTRGNCGPVYQWHLMRNGVPYYEVVTPNSLQYITHYGTAVALSAFPMPPMPLLGEPYYLPHLTEIRRSSPQRYAQGRIGYTTSWRYTYVATSDTLLLPYVR